MSQEDEITFKDTDDCAIGPSKLMRDRHLSGNAKLLYLAIDARVICVSAPIRIETLMADLGWTRTAVKRHAAVLAAAGWLVITRQDDSTIWRLNNAVTHNKLERCR